MTKQRVSLIAFCLTFSVAVCVASTAYNVVVSGKGNYWQTGSVTEGSGTATVTVNESQKNQEWLGFGGCFNEKGWEALQKLSETDRNKAIKLLFDVNDGIGFTWGRIPIGASDYGITRYTLDETAGDTGMNSFSIDHDKNYLIPFIKAALQVKSDIIFWASAWTPPTWMKTGAADAAGYDGGVMRNEPKYLKANALYTTKFIEAYKAEGITVNAVFPQNEPGYTQNYPSCGWGKYRKPDNTNVDGTEFLSDYVGTYLVPALQSLNPKPDLWFGTLSNNTYASAYWNGAKSKAGQQIKGVGLQWNNITLVQSIASGGYLVMQSEHQCGNYPWKGTTSSVETADSTNFFASYAPNNHAYALESWMRITAWVKAGVHIYSAWNMVLDTGGFNLDQSRKWPQNALLAVNYSSKTLKITPTYYLFRHVAQYVKPHAYRLGTQGGDALAFKNPGPDSSIVVIVYNSGTSAAQTTVALGGKKLQFSVPAQGWATLKPAVTSINDITNNQFSSEGGALRITCKGDGYRVALPSRESGRIELLTLAGRVLESRAIPQGSREILLGKQASHTGVLIVRVVSGSETKTARFFTAH